ncbi:MAG: secreted trypsin-like serine protease [Myxococcota bacterium]|jgi:secreted trypsin-like serine protease
MTVALLALTLAHAGPLGTEDVDGGTWIDARDDASEVLTPEQLALLEEQGPAAIVDGWDVADGDWNDTVGIVYGGMEVGCTGTLIAPDLVLTAGHCISGALGAVLDTNDIGDGSGEWIRALRKIAYPRWGSTYDVGLIQLDTPSAVPPRAIALDCILDTYMVDGAEVAAVGYGATDARGRRYVDQLQETRLEVTDHDCSTRDDDCIRSVQPDGEFIARGLDGTDTCFGDSGGPAYLLTDEGDYVVGVVSRGTRDSGATCGAGTIYVRADAVVPWIEDLSGYELERPECPDGPPPEADSDLDPGPSADVGSEPAAGCSTAPGTAALTSLFLLLPLLRRRQE